MNQIVKAGLSFSTTCFFALAGASVAHADNLNVTTQQDDKMVFINQIAPDVRAISQQYQIYGSVQLAQAILESNYGQSKLTQSGNNFFGMKGAYNGQYLSFPTLEDNGKGKYTKIQAKFKKYPSFYHSLEDNARLIRNGSSWDSLYYAGAWKENASTYKEAAKALEGRYATDTRYADKIIRVINIYKLDQLVDVQYKTMQSVIDTNYTALITQVNRNDGLYWSGPYMTSAQSVKRDDSASKYRGTTVRVVKEAMVGQSRWAKVLLNNREVWIDKNGLRPLNQLANTRYVNYYAKINQTMRNDGLYRSGPYNTSANTVVRDDSAKKYHGYRIRVVAETDVNGKTRWAKIMLPNQQTYWIDKNGLK